RGEATWLPLALSFHYDDAFAPLRLLVPFHLGGGADVVNQPQPQALVIRLAVLPQPPHLAGAEVRHAPLARRPDHQERPLRAVRHPGGGVGERRQHDGLGLDALDRVAAVKAALLLLLLRVAEERLPAGIRPLALGVQLEEREVGLGGREAQAERLVGASLLFL